MQRHIATALAAFAFAAPAVVLGPAGSAYAGSTTTPPLNPAPADYYSCTTNGAGTYCSGQTVQAYGPDPTGLFCGTGTSAFEVLDQAVRVIDAQRWYDRDGNLLKRKRTITFQDARLSNPSGVEVGYVQRDIQTEILDIPGDFGSATTYTNASLRTTVPGLGTVFADKGRVVSSPDGSLLKEAGRHDLIRYLDGDLSALAALCGALGA